MPFSHAAAIAAAGCCAFAAAAVPLESAQSDAALAGAAGIAGVIDQTELGASWETVFTRHANPSDAPPAAFSLERSTGHGITVRLDRETTAVFLRGSLGGDQHQTTPATIDAPSVMTDAAGLEPRPLIIGHAPAARPAFETRRQGTPAVVTPMAAGSASYVATILGGADPRQSHSGRALSVDSARDGWSAVTIIPSPGTAVVVGVAGLAAARRRRSSREPVA